MKNNKVEKLSVDFIESVIKQWDCIEKGDSKTGNKYAKKYIKDVEELIQIGDEGINSLLSLLNHHETLVRLTSAGFLLKHKTEEALKVLNELSNLENMIGHRARHALELWKQGKWNL